MSTMCAVVDMTEDDIYGQRHPVECSELIAAKLKDLEIELDKLPISDKQGWGQAKAKCPDIVNDDAFKLMFLRAEVYNADLAALRLVKYWDKRIELFGLNKAFRPLKLDGALQGDETALGMGFTRLVPAQDEHGRSILLADPSKQDASLYERESMLRAMWYVLHASLENEDAQKRGIVMIIVPKNARFKQFDRHLSKMLMESIKGCLPVRVSAFHICQPPTFFSMIWPIMNLFLGERLRKRVKVYSGSDKKVLEKLQVYGLSNDSIPSELGGNIVLDHKNWLYERRASRM